MTANRFGRSAKQASTAQRRGQKVRYGVLDRVTLVAGLAVQRTLNYLITILFRHREGKLSLADGTCENIHKVAFHLR